MAPAFPGTQGGDGKSLVPVERGEAMCDRGNSIATLRLLSAHLILNRFPVDVNTVGLSLLSRVRLDEVKLLWLTQLVFRVTTLLQPGPVPGLW
jgi:hypothetical protein